MIRAMYLLQIYRSLQIKTCIDNNYNAKEKKQQKKSNLIFYHKFFKIKATLLELFQNFPVHSMQGSKIMLHYVLSEA